MDLKLIEIDYGRCEPVLLNGEPKKNRFKVNKQFVHGEAKAREMVRIYMRGTGYSYHGEISKKLTDYYYFLIY